MHWVLFRLLIIFFLPGGFLSQLIAQTTAISSDTLPAHASSWDFSTAVYFYYLPDEDRYIAPVFYAGYGRLHLETRYNYEDFRTLSLFTGWKFGWGEILRMEATPLLGVILGTTRGMAAGLEIDMAFRNLAFYSEAEYVFNFQDQQENFFYNWAEFSYFPAEWVQLGITSQQTRAHHQDGLTDNGFLAGLNYLDYSVVTYLFNVNRDDVFLIFSLEINF